MHCIEKIRETSTSYALKFSYYAEIGMVGLLFNAVGRADCSKTGTTTILFIWTYQEV